MKFTNNVVWGGVVGRMMIDINLYSNRHKIILIDIKMFINLKTVNEFTENTETA